MNGTILVVDDNEMNRDVLSRRLERHGYRVVLASGGREALELIEHVRFDLALFDIMMPEVSGIEALVIVRETHTLADLPVIMVTAKSQREDIISALEKGANDYVTKPVDFPVLLARIKTHIELHRLSALKDEFLSIASHDLKNPLTDIMGVASLVEAVVPPGAVMPEKLHSLITAMKMSARRMQTIIEDFLDFQALENGVLALDLQDIDLADLIKEVVAANEGYALTKRIQLAVEIPDDLPTVPADRPRIYQVVQNLVENALKYGRPDGTATVSLAVSEGSVVFGVADTGPGLLDADLTRVFEKFIRVGTVPTGGEKSSGLGLNIGKRLVELHGGAIGARNNPGGGATFWFSLPIEANVVTEGVPL